MMSQFKKKIELNIYYWSNIVCLTTKGKKNLSATNKTKVNYNVYSLKSTAEAKNTYFTKVE